MVVPANPVNARKHNRLHQTETVIPARHRVIIKVVHPDKGQARSRQHPIEVANRSRGPAPGKEANLIGKLILTEVRTHQLEIKTHQLEIKIHRREIEIHRRKAEILVETEAILIVAIPL